MKYDDATWHSGGDFPSDLPPEAGATHTGMYVAWALLTGLAGDLHIEELADDLRSLRERTITPGAFFLKTCDGKFTDEDLSEEGNAFTQKYFDFEKGKYLEDYELVFLKSIPSLYHVADSWNNFDLLSPLSTKDWRNGAVSPNKSLQRSVNHKVLGRGRVVSAPCRAPRARVLTGQPAAAELSR